jgi:hypothetical protein
MDNEVRSPTSAEQDDVVRVAELVRQDLSDLLGILERQLGNASSADGPTWSRLSQAKSAAERGVALSERLVALLHRSATS